MDLFKAMDLGHRFFPRLTAAVILIMMVFFHSTLDRLFLRAANAEGARLTALMQRAIQLPEPAKAPPHRHAPRHRR
jgi:hypothetical protein